MAAPAWVRSSTAEVPPLAALPPAATPTQTVLPEAAGPPVVELLAEVPTPPPLATPLLTVQSPDGRLVLTATHLTVFGQTYGLRELERAEVQHVRWVLWVLLGGLGLAIVLICFLQNRLHTLPAMLGVAGTALLLAYGQRGTNRLRLWRLGREAAHVALPGELAPWQRLTSELNRRIARAHDQAAAEATYLLAVAAAEQAATSSGRPDTDTTFPTPLA